MLEGFGVATAEHQLQCQHLANLVCFRFALKPQRAELQGDGGVAHEDRQAHGALDEAGVAGVTCQVGVDVQCFLVTTALDGELRDDAGGEGIFLNMSIFNRRRWELFRNVGLCCFPCCRNAVRV